MRLGWARVSLAVLNDGLSVTVESPCYGMMWFGGGMLVPNTIKQSDPRYSNVNYFAKSNISPYTLFLLMAVLGLTTS